jgi:FkbM family methyltransferase
MIKGLKTRVRKALRYAPKAVEKRLLAQRSYAQEGEDRLLLRYFGLKYDGFYVDVGAHHPYRFSNTQLFYEMGWSGINIDAMPGSMAAFRRARRRDVNLEQGVGEAASTARFFVFNETALNTFDEETARKHDVLPWKIEQVIEIRVEPLRDILARHLPEGRKIDFLSIDVEGRDLSVLRSNDWEKYRPEVVLAESLHKTLDDLADDPGAAFLRSVGYIPYAKTVNTFLFIEGGK